MAPTKGKDQCLAPLLLVDLQRHLGAEAHLEKEGRLLGMILLNGHNVVFPPF